MTEKLNSFYRRGTYQLIFLKNLFTTQWKKQKQNGDMNKIFPKEEKHITNIIMTVALAVIKIKIKWYKKIPFSKKAKREERILKYY